MLASFTRIDHVLFSQDAKTRIRLHQWALALCVYVAGSGVMHLLALLGALTTPNVFGWQAFNLSGLALFYVLIRSGWSQRFKDPSLAQAQMLFGVANAMWCYWIGGEIRSVMLLPLLVIFTFGAFSLQWHRIAALTGVALLSTAIVMVAMHRWSPDPLSPTTDLANFLVLSILLPATSVVTINLGRLRQKLKSQRLELTEALARIQELAMKDALTGLFNRRHTEKIIDTEIARSARTGRGFSIAVVDLDHFKRVNDRYGHPAGDEVLRHFADLAQRVLRTADVIARWGGEEFLIVLPESTYPGACIAMERLIDAVRRARVPTEAGEIAFTLSAGVAVWRSDESTGALVARADAALYRAKDQGRDRVEIDTSLPHAPVPATHPIASPTPSTDAATTPESVA